ncbi:FecR family protein [Roseibium algae]|uniref:FecR family protein n=1 Tax=Roseibium algae TaxID=3123038 RepID=A0ABU8TF32_9HYPH
MIKALKFSACEENYRRAIRLYINRGAAKQAKWRKANGSESMLSRETELTTRQRLSEEAVDWLLKLQGSPNDQGLHEQFQVWLDHAPQHHEAWSRTCRMWDRLGALSPETRKIPDQLEKAPVWSTQSQLEVAELPSKKMRGRITAVSVALAVAACFLVLLAPTWLIHYQADHYTDPGEIRTIHLEDGSNVTLAAASAIKLDFDNKTRQLTLLSGEAFFDVSHDASRPFLVTADNLNISVLGTQFNVRLGQETTDVALLKGSVKAKAGHDKAVASAVLRPGEQLKLDDVDGTIELSKINLDQIAAWRKHRLYVMNETLESVAQQIGRYHSGWIAIPDTRLANQRVTGAFDLTNPEKAMRALVAPFGGQVYEINNYFMILLNL